MLNRVANVSVKMKIVGMATLAVVVPVAALLVLTSVQGWRLNGQLARELSEQTDEQLAGTVKGVYAVLQTQQESLDQNLTGNLNVLRDAVARAGGLRVAADTVAWTAVNQFDSSRRDVPLPKLTAGGHWLGQATETGVHVPVIDETVAQVGGAVTIFQRMNPAGDMLRVATTVVTKDGKRGVGTYIPAVHPDGKTNAVVASITQGKPYRGRVFVVDGWYQGLYEPIREGDTVIGMLFAGIRQEKVASLRKSIQETRVGDTGRAFVIGGSGDQAGKWIISPSDGDTGSALATKSTDGREVFADIVADAVKLQDGAVKVHRFKEARNGVATARVVAVSYFKPWDWVIGVAADEADFQGPRERASQAVMWLVGGALGVGLVVGGLALVVAFGVSRRITEPLEHSVEVLESIADGDLSQRLAVHGHDEIGRMAAALNTAADGMCAALADVHRTAVTVASVSRVVSGAADKMSSGAQQQASTLEETAASLEEITGTVKQNADNATHANELASTSRDSAAKGGEIAGKAVEGMGEINRSAHKIAAIITTIDEIAFQTNLLALNAAVEAARAGEQGRGFAVVAAEVRNLAQRAATAAKEIKALIEDSVAKVDTGSELVNRSGATLKEIVGSVKQVTDLIADIATASGQQASGIDQLNKAVMQMDQVTQNNATETDHLSATAQQLARNAAELEQLVTRFKLDGGSERAASAPSASVAPPAPVAPAKRPARGPDIREVKVQVFAKASRKAKKHLEPVETAHDGNGHNGNGHLANGHSTGDDGFEEF